MMLQKLLLNGKSDEELMSLWVESRRTGRGDAAPFEVLWKRHSEASYRTIVRMLGANRSLADDVHQDTWLEVTRATRFVPGSFRAYLRTIATRKALDRLTSAALRTAQPSSLDDEEDSLESVASPNASPVRATEGREAAAIVLGIVANMPALQRVAWTLKYVEEMTFEEISEAMGTPVGTAKTRVRLANEFLADALRERGIERLDVEDDG